MSVEVLREILERMREGVVTSTSLMDDPSSPPTRHCYGWDEEGNPNPPSNSFWELTLDKVCAKETLCQSKRDLRFLLQNGRGCPDSTPRLYTLLHGRYYMEGWGGRSESRLPELPLPLLEEAILLLKEDQSTLLGWIAFFEEELKK